MRLNDVDADGIGVEESTESTEFHFSEETGDYGLWTVNPGDGDPAHPVVRPGESITAFIDSDVSPDDTGLNPWDWWETRKGHAQPMRCLESLDDRDFFRLVIEEECTYDISVTYGPESVGICGTWGTAGFSGITRSLNRS